MGQLIKMSKFNQFEPRKGHLRPFIGVTHVTLLLIDTLEASGYIMPNVQTFLEYTSTSCVC